MEINKIIYNSLASWMGSAGIAVLVEGEHDRAAIPGAAKATKGIELENEGFSVIPCGGKTSLDCPATIFRQLGIPGYRIWDSDKEDPEATPEHNRRLLRLMNQPEED